MAEPPHPPFADGLRRATVEDLPRIALVAAASFFWSPVFQYQRPFHGHFPEDALASYLEEYRSAIQKGSGMVFVSEDNWDSQETDSVFDALRPLATGNALSAPNKHIVAGICSLDLGEISHAHHHKSTHVVNEPDTPPKLRAPGRDLYLPATKQYSDSTILAKESYLSNRMTISTLAVHPAYWRRGHATRLIRWSTDWADFRRLTMGVSAAKLGVKHFQKAGFVEQEKIKIPGYRLPPISPSVSGADQVDEEGDWMEGIELWIGIRPAQPPLQTPPEAHQVVQLSA